MPRPAKLTVSSAEGLTLDREFSVALQGPGAADPRVRAAVARIGARLQRQTGLAIALPAAVSSAAAKLVITVTSAGRPGAQRLGDDESYRLSSDSRQVRISAPHPLGALAGIETLLQLVQSAGAGATVPAVEIEDAPRFPWRGLTLDVSRHFIPIEGVKRTIDGLAAVKLNVLHWHLSDDQGFRVECRKYPKLHKLGSEGHYYTQAEIRDVLAYARERGVRVVPEFDIPGHATSWFAAYPQLGSGKGPYKIVHTYGILTATMDPTRESTYEFLVGFLGEMAGLFPDEYFHIGGDEVDPQEWKASRHIRAFIRKHHLHDEHGLQAYFNRRVQKILSSHHKRMVGWDEVLQPGLPHSIAIQSWRGEKALAAAAQQGFQVILSHGYYLDLMSSAAQHYAVDPMAGEAAALDVQAQKRVLGGEAAMWTELAPPEVLDARLWPRLAAIAERFWSPATVNDPESMYARLAGVSRYLESYGLTHRTYPRLAIDRLAGAKDPRPLRAFAAVLEPVKGYARHNAGRGKYGTDSPYNRLVDALPPESDAARDFRNAVDQFLKNRTSVATVEGSLRQWSALISEVLPMLQSAPLLQETAPVAEDLGALCRTGLDALRIIKSGAPAGEGWTKEHLKAVDDAAAGKAELLVQIAPGVRKLVEAAGAAK